MCIVRVAQWQRLIIKCMFGSTILLLTLFPGSTRCDKSTLPVSSPISVRVRVKAPITQMCHCTQGFLGCQGIASVDMYSTMLSELQEEKNNRRKDSNFLYPEELTLSNFLTGLSRRQGIGAGQGREPAPHRWLLPSLRDRGHGCCQPLWWNAPFCWSQLRLSPIIVFVVHIKLGECPEYFKATG